MILFCLFVLTGCVCSQPVHPKKQTIKDAKTPAQAKLDEIVRKNSGQILGAP